MTEVEVFNAITGETRKGTFFEDAGHIYQKFPTGLVELEPRWMAANNLNICAPYEVRKQQYEQSHKGVENG